MKKEFPPVFRHAALAALAVLGCSCSTIVNGSRQSVPVSSEPAGAAVSLDGERVGETPCHVEVPRSRHPHVVTVEKEGFSPFNADLKPSMDDWVIGNIVFGGIIGVIVDLSSGSFYEFSPVQIEAELSADGAAPAPKPEPPPAPVATPAPVAAPKPEPPPAPAPVVAVPKPEPEPAPAPVVAVPKPEPVPAPVAAPAPKPPSPQERRLAFLREMFSVGAMTAREVRDEVSGLDLSDAGKAAFLSELGIRTE